MLCVCRLGVIQGELEEAIREVMAAKPFFLEANDAQVLLSTVSEITMAPLLSYTKTGSVWKAGVRQPLPLEQTVQP